MPLFNYNEIGIHRMKAEDIDPLVHLWYAVSVKAHHFISANYWHRAKEKMRSEYLPGSETYVARIDNQIVGFVSMLDAYLAAIFINPSMQGQGVGGRLMDHVKRSRQTIQLKVYKKNEPGIRFYQKHGFQSVSEHLDQETEEMELFMEWKR